MTKEQLVEQWQMERRDQDYVKWLENKLLESTTHDAVLGYGWRDCMEELPEESGDCIVYTNDNRIEIDEYTTQFGWYVDRVGGKVVAWMPLSAIGKPAFA